jgi:hypothetical protein
MAVAVAKTANDDCLLIFGLASLDEKTPAIASDWNAMVIAFG